jgi:hypothetical protein
MKIVYNNLERWLTNVLLTSSVLLGCSSTSDSQGSPVAGSSGSSSMVGGGGASTAGVTGLGGSSGAAAGGNSGNADLGGTSGLTGMLTESDAVAAINAGCAAALQQCPQLNTSNCRAESVASVPAEGASCFQEYVKFLQCVAKLPPSTIQCSGDQAIFNQDLCPAENTAVDDCYTADAGP